MEAEELLRRYAAGERDFTGIQISRCDLRDVDLSGANFTKASFKGRVDLSGANLSGANFTKAYLGGVDFRGTNLSGANCRDAYLSGTELEEVNFTRANLVNAVFAGAIDNGIFIDADLSGASFSESVALGTIFYRANMDDVVIMECTFHGVNFTKATLRRARIENTSLTNAIFIETDLTGVDWGGVDTDRAIFYKTIMPDGSIRNLNCG